MPYLKDFDLFIEDEHIENCVENMMRFVFFVHIEVPTRIAFQMLMATASSPSF